MRELELIEALEQVLARTGGPASCAGSATTPPSSRGGGYAVTSVDAMVDGVHFRTGQLAPEEIGHRALAAAAVGSGGDGRAGRARRIWSSACRAGSRPTTALALVGGARALADETGVDDRRRRRDPRRRADRVVHGRRMGRATPASWSRETARARATGSPSRARSGRRARGWRCSTAAPARASTTSVADALRERYARPRPRLHAGRALRRARRTRDDRPVRRARHRRRPYRAAERRADRAVAGALPLAEGVAEVAGELGVDPRSFAATAGDDYELCVCVPARARRLENARPRSLEGD